MPRMIRLGVWRTDVSDEDDPGRTFKATGVDARVDVDADAVLEKSMPSVSRRKVSNSAVSPKKSSSVEDGKTAWETAFAKPCEDDAISLVEGESAAASSLGRLGVLGSDMLSQSISKSASSSSHALHNQNRTVRRERLQKNDARYAYLGGAEASVTPAIGRSLGQKTWETGMQTGSVPRIHK